MKKLKPVRVWAVTGKSSSLRLADICWNRSDINESLDTWGRDEMRVVPCMLVPIEPKNRRVKL